MSYPSPLAMRVSYSVVWNTVLVDRYSGNRGDIGYARQNLACPRGYGRRSGHEILPTVVARGQHALSRHALDLNTHEGLREFERPYRRSAGVGMLRPTWSQLLA